MILNQYGNEGKEEFDRYFLVFEGEIKVNEKALKAHEMVFVPRDTIIKLNCHKKALVLVISNKSLSTKDFLSAAFAKAMKDPIFSQNLPHDFLFSGSDSTDEILSLLE